MTASWMSPSRDAATQRQLYRNQGDGTFVDVTAAAGLNPQNHCQGLAWGDYNNDGLLDLYVARGARAVDLFKTRSIATMATAPSPM